MLPGKASAKKGKFKEMSALSIYKHKNADMFNQNQNFS